MLICCPVRGDGGGSMAGLVPSCNDAMRLSFFGLQELGGICGHLLPTFPGKRILLSCLNHSMLWNQYPRLRYPRQVATRQ